MNVEIDETEARAILEALERKASERTSVFQAAIRAKVRRKMRVIVAGPYAGRDVRPQDFKPPGCRARPATRSSELTKALNTILGLDARPDESACPWGGCNGTGPAGGRCSRCGTEITRRDGDA